MSKQLRLANVLVQPVLMWDDGEELTPGPEINPVSVPPSSLVEFAETLPEQVKKLQYEAETENDNA